MRKWMSVRFLPGTMIVLAAVALSGCGASGSSATSSVAATPSGSTTSGSTTSGSTTSGSTTSGSTTSTPPPATTKAVQVSVSGTPETTVTAGQPYSFTPTATVSSGTATFSIQNAPAWATFNTSTGSLSGTPATASVGTYGNIIISASAGGSSASLPAFAITVAAPNSPAGGADVSWTPPTTATDGSTLTDLAGYNIYYGTSLSTLTQKVQITNIGVTNYVITGLSSGTWYFVVTSYTTSGTESVPSNVATATIS